MTPGLLNSVQRCDTFSGSHREGVIAAFAMAAAMTFSAGVADDVMFIPPHSIVELCEVTSSSLLDDGKGISESNTVVDMDLYAQEKISMLDFSAELFDGIRSYTEEEAIAHTRAIKKISVNSGVNILAYLQ